MRIVICTNDYPHCILPEGTTLDEARVKADQLREIDPHNVEHKRNYPMDSGWRVYYRCHEIPEIEL